jgi:ferredoxin
MKTFRHLENVATLAYDKDKCVGCGLCATVCPHRIFAVQDGKAEVLDREACMECGACALNCPDRRHHGHARRGLRGVHHPDLAAGKVQDIVLLNP